MKLTPSQVKNLMRKGLLRLLDPMPELEEREKCAAFFEGCCAYCGAKIPEGQGDMDHLLSEAKGGRNHISNRVFSCKTCNQEEKREKEWEAFLHEKNIGNGMEQIRKDKIIAWIKEAGAMSPLSETALIRLDYHTTDLSVRFDNACRDLRRFSKG